MNEEANTTQREKRHAVLYFSPKNSKAYKALAARIRSDGGRTTLVWSNQWKGAESILPECRGVVIEEGCKNADDIVESYRRYATDVEIHFTDENGEFSDGEEEAAPTTEGGEVPAPGATENEEKQPDPDATSDSVVEEATTKEGGENTVDPDGSSEDTGTADDSGKAGSEKPTDSS